MRFNRLRLLLVEDNPADVFLLQAAAELADLPLDLTVAADGAAALALLSGLDAEGAWPQLVLLDLNMPRMNGFEVLQALQASAFPPLPVVMFTTSSAPADLQRAAALGAASFVTKPAELAALVTLLQQLPPAVAGEIPFPHSAAWSGRPFRPPVK